AFNSLHGLTGAPGDDDAPLTATGAVSQDAMEALFGMLWEDPDNDGIYTRKYVGDITAQEATQAAQDVENVQIIRAALDPAAFNALYGLSGGDVLTNTGPISQRAAEIIYSLLYDNLGAPKYSGVISTAELSNISYGINRAGAILEYLEQNATQDLLDAFNAFNGLVGGDQFVTGTGNNHPLSDNQIAALFDAVFDEDGNLHLASSATFSAQQVVEDIAWANDFKAYLAANPDVEAAYIALLGGGPLANSDYFGPLYDVDGNHVVTRPTINASFGQDIIWANDFRIYINDASHADALAAFESLNGVSAGGLTVGYYYYPLYYYDAGGVLRHVADRPNVSDNIAGDYEQLAEDIQWANDFRFYLSESGHEGIGDDYAELLGLTDASDLESYHYFNPLYDANGVHVLTRPNVTDNTEGGDYEQLAEDIYWANRFMKLLNSDPDALDAYKRLNGVTTLTALTAGMYFLPLYDADGAHVSTRPNLYAQVEVDGDLVNKMLEGIIRADKLLTALRDSDVKGEDGLTAFNALNEHIGGYTDITGSGALTAQQLQAIYYSIYNQWGNFHVEEFNAEEAVDRIVGAKECLDFLVWLVGDSDQTTNYANDLNFGAQGLTYGDYVMFEYYEYMEAGVTSITGAEEFVFYTLGSPTINGQSYDIHHPQYSVLAISAEQFFALHPELVGEEGDGWKLDGDTVRLVIRKDYVVNYDGLGAVYVGDEFTGFDGILVATNNERSITLLTTWKRIQRTYEIAPGEDPLLINQTELGALETGFGELSFVWAWAWDNIWYIIFAIIGFFVIHRVAISKSGRDRRKAARKKAKAKKRAEDKTKEPKELKKKLDPTKLTEFAELGIYHRVEELLKEKLKSQFIGPVTAPRGWKEAATHVDNGLIKAFRGMRIEEIIESVKNGTINAIYAPIDEKLKKKEDLTDPEEEIRKLFFGYEKLNFLKKLTARKKKHENWIFEKNEKKQIELLKKIDGKKKEALGSILGIIVNYKIEQLSKNRPEGFTSDLTAAEKQQLKEIMQKDYQDIWGEDISTRDVSIYQTEVVGDDFVDGDNYPQCYTILEKLYKKLIQIKHERVFNRIESLESYGFPESLKLGGAEAPSTVQIIKNNVITKVRDELKVKTKEDAITDFFAPYGAWLNAVEENIPGYVQDDDRMFAVEQYWNQVKANSAQYAVFRKENKEFKTVKDTESYNKLNDQQKKAIREKAELNFTLEDMCLFYMLFEDSMFNATTANLRYYLFFTVKKKLRTGEIANKGDVFGFLEQEINRFEGVVHVNDLIYGQGNKQWYMENVSGRQQAMRDRMIIYDVEDLFRSDFIAWYDGLKTVDKKIEILGDPTTVSPGPQRQAIADRNKRIKVRRKAAEAEIDEYIEILKMRPCKIEDTESNGIVEELEAQLAAINGGVKKFDDETKKKWDGLVAELKTAVAVRDKTVAAYDKAMKEAETEIPATKIAMKRAYDQLDEINKKLKEIMNGWLEKNKVLASSNPEKYWENITTAGESYNAFTKVHMVFSAVLPGTVYNDLTDGQKKVFKEIISLNYTPEQYWQSVNVSDAIYDDFKAEHAEFVAIARNADYHTLTQEQKNILTRLIVPLTVSYSKIKKLSSRLAPYTTISKDLSPHLVKTFADVSGGPGGIKGIFQMFANVYWKVAGPLIMTILSSFAFFIGLTIGGAVITFWMWAFGAFVAVGILVLVGLLSKALVKYWQHDLTGKDVNLFEIKEVDSENLSTEEAKKLKKERWNARLFVWSVFAVKFIWNALIWRFIAIPVMMFLMAGSHTFLGITLFAPMLVIPMLIPFILFFMLDIFAITYILQSVVAYISGKRSGAGAAKFMSHEERKKYFSSVMSNLEDMAPPTIKGDDGLNRVMTDLEKKLYAAMAWNNLIKRFNKDDYCSQEEMEMYLVTITDIPIGDERVMKEGDFLALKDAIDPADIKYPNFDENVVNPMMQRRLAMFFAQTFMKLDRMPAWERMKFLSVVTPLLSEVISYPFDYLDPSPRRKDRQPINVYMENVGKTMLTEFIEQYPNEWGNFVERIKSEGKYLPEDILELERIAKIEKSKKGYEKKATFAEGEDKVLNFDKRKDPKTILLIDQIREWVSYRYQPAARTIRGMMNYREHYTFLAKVNHPTWASLSAVLERDITSEGEYNEGISELVDEKVEYILADQGYGGLEHTDAHRIDVNAQLRKYPNFKVAYLGNYKKGVEDRDFSALLQFKTGEAQPDEIVEQVISDAEGNYIGRIVRIGYIKHKARTFDDCKQYNWGFGKPLNQNNIMRFARGSIIQFVDMNQDLDYEQVYFQLMLMGRFDQDEKLAVLGVPERVITEDSTFIGQVVAFGEHTFVTGTQRTLNIFGIRGQYGHPDFLRASLIMTLGLIVPPYVNEDIFAAYILWARGYRIDRSETMYVGKAREGTYEGFFAFYSKLAGGAAEQTMSRQFKNATKHMSFSQGFLNYTLGVGNFIKDYLVPFTTFSVNFIVIFLGLSGFLALPAAILFGFIGIIFSQAITMMGWSQQVLDKGLWKGTIDMLKIFPRLVLVYGSMLYIANQPGVVGGYQTGAKYFGSGRGFADKHAPPYIADYDALDLHQFVRGPGSGIAVASIFSTVLGIFLWINFGMIWSFFVMAIPLFTLITVFLVNPGATPFDVNIRTWVQNMKKDYGSSINRDTGMREGALAKLRLYNAWVPGLIIGMFGLFWWLGQAVLTGPAALIFWPWLGIGLSVVAFMGLHNKLLDRNKGWTVKILSFMGLMATVGALIFWIAPVFLAAAAALTGIQALLLTVGAYAVQGVAWIVFGTTIYATIAGSNTLEKAGWEGRIISASIFVVLGFIMWFAITTIIAGLAIPAVLVSTVYLAAIALWVVAGLSLIPGAQKWMSKRVKENPGISMLLLGTNGRVSIWDSCKLLVTTAVTFASQIVVAPFAYIASFFKAKNIEHRKKDWEEMSKARSFWNSLSFMAVLPVLAVVGLGLMISVLLPALLLPETILIVGLAINWIFVVAFAAITFILVTFRLYPGTETKWKKAASFGIGGIASVITGVISVIAAVMFSSIFASVVALGWITALFLLGIAVVTKIIAWASATHEKKTQKKINEQFAGRINAAIKTAKPLRVPGTPGTMVGPVEMAAVINHVYTYIITDLSIDIKKAHSYVAKAITGYITTKVETIKKDDEKEARKIEIMKGIGQIVSDKAAPPIELDYSSLKQEMVISLMEDKTKENPFIWVVKLEKEVRKYEKDGEQDKADKYRKRIGKIHKYIKTSLFDPMDIYIENMGLDLNRLDQLKSFAPEVGQGFNVILREKLAKPKWRDSFIPLYLEYLFANIFETGAHRGEADTAKKAVFMVRNFGMIMGLSVEKATSEAIRIALDYRRGVNLTLGAIDVDTQKANILAGISNSRLLEGIEIDSRVRILHGAIEPQKESGEYANVEYVSAHRVFDSGDNPGTIRRILKTVVDNVQQLLENDNKKKDKKLKKKFGEFEKLVTGKGSQIASPHSNTDEKAYYALLAIEKAARELIETAEKASKKIENAAIKTDAENAVTVVKDLLNNAGWWNGTNVEEMKAAQNETGLKQVYTYVLEILGLVKDKQQYEEAYAYAVLLYLNYGSKKAEITGVINNLLRDPLDGSATVVEIKLNIEKFAAVSTFLQPKPFVTPILEKDAEIAMNNVEEYAKIYSGKATDEGKNVEAIESSIRAILYRLNKTFGRKDRVISNAIISKLSNINLNSDMYLAGINTLKSYVNSFILPITPDNTARKRDLEEAIKTIESLRLGRMIEELQEKFKEHFKDTTPQDAGQAKIAFLETLRAAALGVGLAPDTFSEQTLQYSIEAAIKVAVELSKETEIFEGMLMQLIDICAPPVDKKYFASAVLTLINYEIKNHGQISDMPGKIQQYLDERQNKYSDSGVVIEIIFREIFGKPINADQAEDSIKKAMKASEMIRDASDEDDIQQIVDVMYKHAVILLPLQMGEVFEGMAKVYKELSNNEKKWIGEEIATFPNTPDKTALINEIIKSAFGEPKTKDEAEANLQKAIDAAKVMMGAGAVEKVIGVVFEYKGTLLLAAETKPVDEGIAAGYENLSDEDKESVESAIGDIVASRRMALVAAILKANFGKPTTTDEAKNALDSLFDPSLEMNKSPIPLFQEQADDSVKVMLKVVKDYLDTTPPADLPGAEKANVITGIKEQLIALIDDNSDDEYIKKALLIHGLKYTFIEIDDTDKAGWIKQALLAIVTGTNPSNAGEMETVIEVLIDDAESLGLTYTEAVIASVEAGFAFANDPAQVLIEGSLIHGIESKLSKLTKDKITALASAADSDAGKFEEEIKALYAGIEKAFGLDTDTGDDDKNTFIKDVLKKVIEIADPVDEPASKAILDTLVKDAQSMGKTMEEAIKLSVEVIFNYATTGAGSTKKAEIFDGIFSFYNALNDVSQDSLCKGVGLIIDGADKEELKKIILTKIYGTPAAGDEKAAFGAAYLAAVALSADETAGATLVLNALNMADAGIQKGIAEYYADETSANRAGLFAAINAKANVDLNKAVIKAIYGTPAAGGEKAAFGEAYSAAVVLSAADETAGAILVLNALNVADVGIQKGIAEYYADETSLFRGNLPTEIKAGSYGTDVADMFYDSANADIAKSYKIALIEKIMEKYVESLAEKDNGAFAKILVIASGLADGEDADKLALNSTLSYMDKNGNETVRGAIAVSIGFHIAKPDVDSYRGELLGVVKAYIFTDDAVVSKKNLTNRIMKEYVEKLAEKDNGAFAKILVIASGLADGEDADKLALNSTLSYMDKNGNKTVRDAIADAIGSHIALKAVNSRVNLFEVVKAYNFTDDTPPPLTKEDKKTSLVEKITEKIYGVPTTVTEAVSKFTQSVHATVTMMGDTEKKKAVETAIKIAKASAADKDTIVYPGIAAYVMANNDDTDTINAVKEAKDDALTESILVLELNKTIQPRGDLKKTVKEGAATQSVKNIIVLAGKLGFDDKKTIGFLTKKIAALPAVGSTKTSYEKALEKYKDEGETRIINKLKNAFANYNDADDVTKKALADAIISVLNEYRGVVIKDKFGKKIAAEFNNATKVDAFGFGIKKVFEWILTDVGRNKDPGLDIINEVLKECKEGANFEAVISELYNNVSANINLAEILNLIQVALKNQKNGEVVAAGISAVLNNAKVTRTNKGVVLEAVKEGLAATNQAVVISGIEALVAYTPIPPPADVITQYDINKLIQDILQNRDILFEAILTSKYGKPKTAAEVKTNLGLAVKVVKKLRKYDNPVNRLNAIKQVLLVVKDVDKGFNKDFVRNGIADYLAENDAERAEIYAAIKALGDTDIKKSDKTKLINIIITKMVKEAKMAKAVADAGVRFNIAVNALISMTGVTDEDKVILEKGFIMILGELSDVDMASDELKNAVVAFVGKKEHLSKLYEAIKQRKKEELIVAVAVKRAETGTDATARFNNAVKALTAMTDNPDTLKAGLAAILNELSHSDMASVALRKAVKLYITANKDNPVMLEGLYEAIKQREQNDTTAPYTTDKKKELVITVVKMRIEGVNGGKKFNNAVNALISMTDDTVADDKNIIKAGLEVILNNILMLHKDMASDELKNAIVEFVKKNETTNDQRAGLYEAIKKRNTNVVYKKEHKEALINAIVKEIYNKAKQEALGSLQVKGQEGNKAAIVVLQIFMDYDTPGNKAKALNTLAEAVVSKAQQQKADYDALDEEIKGVIDEILDEAYREGIVSELLDWIKKFDMKLSSAEKAAEKAEEQQKIAQKASEGAKIEAGKAKNASADMRSVEKAKVAKEEIELALKNMKGFLIIAERALTKASEAQKRITDKVTHEAQFNNAGIAIKSIKDEIRKITALLGGTTALLKGAKDALETARDAEDALKEKIENQEEIIENAFNKIKGLSEQASSEKEKVVNAYNEAVKIKDVKTADEAVNKAKQAVTNIKTFSDEANNAYDSEMEIEPELLKKVKPQITLIEQMLDGMKENLNTVENDLLINAKKALEVAEKAEQDDLDKTKTAVEEAKKMAEEALANAKTGIEEVENVSDDLRNIQKTEKALKLAKQAKKKIEEELIIQAKGSLEEVKKLHGEIDEDKYESAITTINTAIDGLQAELDKLTKADDGLLTKINKASEKLEKKKKEIGKTTKEVQQVLAEVNGAVNEVQRAVNNIEDVGAADEALKLAGETKKKIDELNTQISEVLKTAEDIEYGTGVITLKNLQKETNNLKQRIDGLTEQADNRKTEEQKKKEEEARIEKEKLEEEAKKKAEEEQKKKDEEQRKLEEEKKKLEEEQKRLEEEEAK
ncbi:hypothetical protein ACFL58_03840, partial [Elusimicrobiota bacterium]